MTVECLLAGASAEDGRILYVADLNLSSASARVSRAKILRAAARTDDIGIPCALAFAKLWIAALYLPLVIVWGVWYEVRLLMPLYPVLIPLVLSPIWVPEAETSSHTHGERVGP